jgi:N-acetylneuraminate synthase
MWIGGVQSGLVEYNVMVYIIAEVGINHNGDKKLAHELIRKAAEAGCDAVKFQKRTVDLVYTAEELAKPRESPWGSTNRDQKEGLEFDISTHVELAEYAKYYKLDFIESCWDLQSLKEVEEFVAPRYHKIASAMLTNLDFLEAINNTGVPSILSTGMSTHQEVERAMNYLINVTHIMACTSTYPTRPEEVNLRYMDELRSLYPGKYIGFSNHYSGGLALYGAVARGAEVVEFHITKDRTMYGSDQAASIEHVDVVVEGMRKIEKMLGDGRKVVYDSEVPIRQKLRK